MARVIRMSVVMPGPLMRKVFLCLVFVLALTSVPIGEAQAKTLRVNNGKIQSIYYDSDVLVVTLTKEALNYGWTGWGADELAKHVIWLVERDGRSCQNIRISKLARQIRLHCAAYSVPSGRRIKEHANPINMTWRELR